MASRIEKIFNDIIDEENQRIHGIQIRTHDIDQSLEHIQRKLLDNARYACKSEYKWLTESGQIGFDDKGFKVKINENHKVDADAKMGNFLECFSRNDMGMKDYFDKVNLNINSLHSQNLHCLDHCVQYEQDKTDNEIKSCMKKCLLTAHNNLNNLLVSIENKIGDFKPRI
jgi:hypothetical protein